VKEWVEEFSPMPAQAQLSRPGVVLYNTRIYILYDFVHLHVLLNMSLFLLIIFRWAGGRLGERI
jgi:hypothetical protein